MTVPATYQTNTKTASGGRTPQADAPICVSNSNSFEREYVGIWEQYYGRIVPRGYVVHHLLGDGPYGVDPTYLLTMPRHLHTAMHNRARSTGRLELPKGWAAVGGVLTPQSDAPARSGHRAQMLVKVGADHRGQSDQRVVGIVASASRITHKRAVAGLITLPAVPLLPLPDHAKKRARLVYAIVGEIFAARWSVYPSAPIPLTRDYVAKWPDGTISAKTAERGVRDLVNLGILKVTGTEPSHCGRPMLLYLPTPVTADAPPVVAEAMPIPLTFRTSLRMYADPLDDTTDQRPYWQLKRERHEFEPYVPGLFACRDMRACAALIRARLAEDEPVTTTPPANVAEAVRERRTHDPGPYLRGCGIALTALRRRLKAIIAEAGSYRTFEDDMKIAALLRRVALIEHLHAEQCLDNGVLYRTSPFAQWFQSLSSNVSPEATARVERNARVPYFRGVSYHPVAA